MTSEKNPNFSRCYCYINSVLKNVIDKLSKNYDITLLDSPAGLEHLPRKTGFGEFSAKLDQRQKKNEKEGRPTFPIVRKKMNLFYLDAVKKNS